jgi:carbon monoxide dehydrogenase subunit G
MAMKFTGDFVVKKGREEVFDFLTDPSRFAPLLPDYQGMTLQDAHNFTVKVKVGVSYMNGATEVKMVLDKADRPTHALYKGQGQLPGGSASVSAGFELAESPEGTKVSWTGEAQVVGKFTSLAGGLLEPLAKKNVQKLIDGLKAVLS